MIPETSRMGRRAFMDRVLALGAAVGLGAGVRTAAAQPVHAAATPPDEAWLTRLTGRHKQLFDSPNVNPRMFANVRNFLNAYHEAYGLGDRDVSALVVVYARAVPLVFGDAAWEALELGKRLGIKDAAGVPVKRNPFRAGSPEGVPAEMSIETLKSRGVVFILCNNSFNHFISDLVAEGHGTAAELRERLLGWKLPDVPVVPAAVLAINRAQEAGLTYIFTG